MVCLRCDSGKLRRLVEGSEVLLMIEILRYLKDPKLWELWYIFPYYG